MDKKRITLKEIAELAGVSTATVSRVINKNGRFSKETEQRVLEIINKFNYSPNQLASSLRKNKGNIVGIILPDITNEFFAEIALKIQLYLLKQNYLAIICNTNESEDIEKAYLLMLNARLVAGLIYITHDSTELNFSPTTPTIYIDRKPFQKDLHKHYIFIESENLQGGYLATNHLIERNCKKIAIISLGGNRSSHMNRYYGYKKAVIEAGFPEDENLVTFVDAANYEEGYRATHSIVENNPNLDAIFYTTDILALGALRSLQEKGLRVPEDIKVVGFDDIHACSYSVPPLTTVQQSIEDIAVLAVENLMSIVKGNEVDNRIITYPVKLIKRKSTY